MEAAAATYRTLLDRQPNQVSSPIRIKPQHVNSSSAIAIPIGATQQQRTELQALENGKTYLIHSDTLDQNGGLLQRTEFLTVSCQCRFNGTGLAKTTAYSRWDAVSRTLQPIPGDWVEKPQGCERNPLSGACDTTTNSLCQRCCHDHHDPDVESKDPRALSYCDPLHGILDRCYDPFRDSADYNHGQHQHYDASGQVVNSGDYEESCRFRAINGSWEVYQDWHRLDLLLLPQPWLQTHSELYQRHVRQTLSALLNHSTTPFYGQLRPDDASVIPWPDKNALGLTTAWPIPLGTRLRLSARGLYLDYLNLESISGLRAQLEQTEDNLHGIPFYELELNTLAPWCQPNREGGWCVGVSGQLQVGAGPFAAPNGLSPGMVESLQSGMTPESVSFSLRRSNSGLSAAPWPNDRFQGLNSDHSLDSTRIELHSQ